MQPTVSHLVDIHMSALPETHRFISVLSLLLLISLKHSGFIREMNVITRYSMMFYMDSLLPLHCGDESNTELIICCLEAILTHIATRHANRYL